jgi:threonine aldolase
MPNSVLAKLRETHHCYDISADHNSTTVRLMTSWATTNEQIDNLINAMKGAMGETN